MRQAIRMQLPQGGKSAVAIGDNGICDRLANPNIAIIPNQATLIGVIVEPTHFVGQIGEFTEDAETMGESRRHIELPRSLVANSIPYHRPKLEELGRKSTVTSKIRPQITVTTCACER